MEKLRLGILGTGKIAATMASTVREMKEATLYAVASREYGKARAFADTYGAEKAYGSYEELARDENVDLVYVASPHSHHYEHAGCASKTEGRCCVRRRLPKTPARQRSSFPWPGKRAS